MVERKFFGNCQKNFGRAAKTGFHTNISQKNTDSEKSLFHLNFGHRAEQFLPFVDVFQGGVVKVTFYVSFGKFWGIFLIFFFLSLSVKDTDWKKIRLFLKNISTEFSKLHSRCPRENIGEIFFIQNIVFFILFGQWAKSCRPFDKFFMAEFWKLHSTCPQKQFENFFAKKTNFPSFLDFDWKNLCLFPEKFRRGCQNCIPPVHRNISRSFFGKSTISSLLDVVGELLDLFRNCFGGVVKFCNCVSIETFRGKKSFFPSKMKFFKRSSSWEKIFR